MTVWLIYAGILIYMEIVLHLGCFGLQGVNPVLLIGLIVVLSAFETLAENCFYGKKKKLVRRILFGAEYFIFAVQAVYFHIFRQPLQFAAIFLGGQNALTGYWRETLMGIAGTMPLLALLVLPILFVELFGKKLDRQRGEMPLKQKLVVAAVAEAALGYCFGCIFVGGVANAGYAEVYREFYDPETVMREMGTLVMVQRDGFYSLDDLFRDLRRPLFQAKQARSGVEAVSGGRIETAPETVSGNQTEAGGSTVSDNRIGTEAVSGDPVDTVSGNQIETGGQTVSGNQIGIGEQEPDTSPNVLNIRLDQLRELSQDSAEKTWLADYIAGLAPTDRNAYTGLFKGYNLIFLTAEGFSTYAVRENLTPTLYKMLHSSFVFPNYYVPLWQTSTSDGEYVNCTGLIPDGQFSMKKSADNEMAYVLPAFFAKEGVYSRAYHSNTLTYYDRHLSHPNLGYDFKAVMLGGLPAEKWGGQLFHVDNPAAWPASDLEMVAGTIGEYINEDRFHVYYMTESGHMNYNFRGNMMAARNREAVEGLDMTENAKAYLACNIELDKAVQYLLEQLEQAGKLENTVICLSADHYPYAMTTEEYEELAGRDLSGDMDMYRNSLILWNAGISEPVIVDKPCCSVDLLPTLLNLFGFDYDSRLYAGRDIFSDGEGLVIFNDQSFVTDNVIYSRRNRTTTWKADFPEEEKSAYLDKVTQDVKDRYQFSAYILRNDYYSLIRQCTE